MARQASKHGRSASDFRPSRRAVLTGAASAAALTVLDSLRPAGADWSPPASPVTVTFWDSTSALKHEALHRADHPRLQAAAADLHRPVREHPDREPPPEDPGSDGHRDRPGDLRAGGLASPHLLRPRPPGSRCHRRRSDSSRWGDLVDSYLPGALSAMQHDGKLLGLPDFWASHSLHINNRLFREAGLDPGPRRTEDVGRRRAAQQGPHQAEGRPDSPEGVRVPLRRRALDVPHAPPSHLSGRGRGRRSQRAAGIQQRRGREGGWRSGRA